MALRLDLVLPLGINRATGLWLQNCCQGGGIRPMPLFFSLLMVKTPAEMGPFIKALSSHMLRDNGPPGTALGNPQ